MNTLQERLSGARHKAGLTQAQLATRAGVSQSTIAQIESGRNSGTKFAVRLAKALDVSVEWLLVGKGSADVPANAAEEAKAADNFSILRDGVSINLVEPRLNLDDEDGVDWDLVQPGAAFLDKSFFEYHGAQPSDCRLVAINGADMEPYLFHGEWAIINTADNDISNGEICAFLFAGDNCVVRQTSWLPGGGLRLRMFNYPDESFDVTPDQVPFLCVLGKVIYRSSRQVFRRYEFK